jgi:hypothetical protein
MAYRQPIDWKILGTPYGCCSWAVIDGSVTVRVPSGSRSAKIEGPSPESLAQLLMHELAFEQNCGG